MGLEMFRDEIENRPPIPMVEISGGDFLIGASESDEEALASEFPSHLISLPSFAIMEHLVRISDYQAFLWDTGYETSSQAIFFNGEDLEMGDLTWEDPGYSYDENFPVTCVNFWDVQEFIKWLREKTGVQYRLPTEAEWEVAARAGTATSRFWGNTMQDAHSYANVSSNNSYKAASPVKSFSANPLGLYDMLGNVFEWTSSDYQEPYDGSELMSSTSSESKAYRGGSFNADSSILRCSARSGIPPELAYNQLGFRLCVDNDTKSQKTIKSTELSGEISKLKFGEKKSFRIDLSSVRDDDIAK